MAAQRISGAIAAAATPLRDDGARLDETAVEPLVRFYAGSGLDGVLLLGTTGEGVLLSPGERRRFAELALAVASPLRVIVHCGAQTTADTEALAAHAGEVGADGVAVIAPPYFALDEHELLGHFAAAAAACAPVPFYVYEYADRSGYSVPVGVVGQLRERASNLAGMKVSDAPFARVRPYLETGLDVFIGAEALIVEGLGGGAAGAVSGLAAAFPELVTELVRDPTPEHQGCVNAVREALSRYPFQAAVKAALGLRGVPVRPDVRGPLRPLSAEARAWLGDELGGLLGRLQGPVPA